MHPVHRFPNVSLLVLGGLAAVFCLFRLQDVIAALVVIRLMIQFLAQTVGVMVFRIRRPDFPRPFRMWFYPLPALVALFGFLYVLIMRNDFTKEIRYGAVILILGIIVFFVAISIVRVSCVRDWRGPNSRDPLRHCRSWSGMR